MKSRFVKRFFAVLLTLALLLSCVPLEVFAQELMTPQASEIYISETEMDEEGNYEAEVVEVASAIELEEALAAKKGKICIVSDFEIDRTFFITHNAAIFSNEAHTLTRKADFVGDIFVVGEGYDGTACEETVTLSVGTLGSQKSDVLVFDGNKGAMETTVTGTVFFVCAKGQVDLYPDVTVTNCEKKGNARSLEKNAEDKYKHTLSNSPQNVGGAVGIIADGGLMNIYGGKYTNNGVVESGLYGGAFFNHSTMNVYDGVFENNYASRAGAFYNYRKMNIYKATIADNEATTLGGAIYLPASSGAILNVGGSEKTDEVQVLFKNNKAENAGAIYSSGTTVLRNTYFESNTSAEAGGAVYGAGKYDNISVYDCTFYKNQAGTNGGAIYVIDRRTSGEVELLVKDSVFSENAASDYGGAVSIVDTKPDDDTESAPRAYFRDTVFEKNTATSGAVFYVDGGCVDTNYVKFTENSATSNGGVVYMIGSAAVVMNEIDAYKNTAKNGGFLYSGEADLKMYNSRVSENTADTGSAMRLYTSASADIYNTVFEANVCKDATTGNAGALFIYTGGTKVTLNRCTLKDNKSNGLGGGLLVSGKSILDLYDVTATGNSAAKGGFMYETTASTVVTVSGLTVSGNTATTGGPIIWGNTLNAKLYINKNNYTDKDVTTSLDDAYWAAAIYNKLTVYDSDAEVPEYDEYDQPDFDTEATSDVKTAKQLEDAINAGFDKIRILKSFEIDRTYYISKNTEIYSDTPVTLTRAKDFVGDIFVVGEGYDGTACEETVTLSVGTLGSQKSDVLVFDGNKGAMEATVTGTVFFVCAKGQVDLYPDVTVTNCEKKGNARSLEKNAEDKYKHTLSNSPKNVGGAVGIIADGGLMNIYGGKYTNNGVVESGLYGGAFFNHSTMNVYDGVFENNYASRAGAFYNYRKMNIYKATIADNEATTLGGAIYLPASSGAILNVGGSEKTDEVQVHFSGNNATNAGAIYSAGTVVLRNACFESNTSAEAGGAVYGSGVYDNISVYNCTFTKNEAGTNGGAIYVVDRRSSIEFELYVKDSVFSENTAAEYGGAVYVFDKNVEDSTESAPRAYMENAAFQKNTAASGGALYVNAAYGEANHVTFTENSATSSGGAVYITGSATVVMNEINAYENTGGKGGFLYSTEADLKIYNSSISVNTADSGSAIYFYTSASAGVYNTVFEGNECKDTNTSNAGALFVYTGGTKVTLNHCTLKDNKSNGLGGGLLVSGKSILELFDVTATGNSAAKGGFMYETTASTVVTVSGLTVSGNTATTGGPIIWGNTFNAKLYINKNNYTDKDVTTSLDDAYWAAAIYNKLTVYDSDAEVPRYPDYGNEEPGGMWDAKDVSSAEELESALEAGEKEIRIVKPFEFDRTFYVTKDTTIFSTARITLKRAAGFGGDIFVVGQQKDGTACEEVVTLSVGIPTSKTKDLFVFDGNKSAVTEPVVGTVFFVCAKGYVKLYENLTVKNFKKTGNERTHEEVHGVSYPDYIGGAVGILAKNAKMDIYGGTYSQNVANESGKGSYGGAFYNFGTMNIYGGLFTGNRASRAGAFYNYRTLNIYNAQIKSNYAATNGGAIYMPASTGAFLYVGVEQEGLTSEVKFISNSAGGNAGAIYANNVADIKNAVFEENKADNGGAIAAYSAAVTVEKSTFTSNAAKVNGGAIFTSGKNSKETAIELTVSDTVFTSNTAVNSGGAVYAKSEARISVKESMFEENLAEADTTDVRYGGGAVLVSGASAEFSGTQFRSNHSLNNGGAVALYSDATAVFMNITSDSDKADNKGAFLYASASEARVYNSEIKNGSADKGGAVAFEEGSDAELIKTILEGNSAVNSGGAVYANTKEGKTFLHSCELLQNTGAKGGALMVEGSSTLEVYNTTAKQNSATYGGVLCVSGEGTQADVNGITVAGNTAATEGAFVYSDSSEAAIKINKKNVTDEDAVTDLDDTYWNQVLAGEYTLIEDEGKIPGYAEYGNETFGYMWDAVDVKSADELEAALAAGIPHIRIVEDFELDRTFIISKSATIFATKPHKLTRAAGFDAVIFSVVNGEGEEQTVFGIGNSVAEVQNLLTIDGNKDNMTVPVTGAIVDVEVGAKAELFDDLTITSCSVAPLVVRGELLIQGGNYTGNTSETDGSLIICDGTVRITQGTFAENKASQNGGLIYNRGFVQIENGTFKKNSALSGGVIYNVGTLEIKGGTFEFNTADNGGTVYNLGSLIVLEATFTSNKASQNGGAIMSESTFSISGTIFKANQALQGGAVYIAAENPGEAGLVIDKATFTGNTAQKGGAIAAEKSSLVITAKFESNKATNGGAVYLGTDCNCNFVDVDAKVDSATQNGGFLYCENSVVSFSGGKIADAVANWSGGAVYAGNGSVVSTAMTDFSNNTAKENGGAICLFGDAVTAKLEKTTFTNNIAETNGGAVYKTDKGLLEITDSNIEGCSAANGAAVCVRDGSVKITDSKFSKNEAKAEGGALLLEGDAVCECINSGFTGNSAKENGGAVSLVTDISKSLFRGNTFTANTAKNGGALYVGSFGVIELYDTTANENIAEYGAVIYQATSATDVTVSGITVAGNKATEEGSIIYGNSSKAVLRIDKTKYIDKDHDGALDDKYWAQAVCGAVGIKNSDDVAPDYGDDVVDVATAVQLERAIKNNAKKIRIIADFNIDRTYFITSDITIYSDSPHVLTRSPEFGGDLFVVGETSDGTRAYLNNKVVKLTMGNPLSEEKDLLIIDGNMGNMQATVNGSVFFVSYGANVDLYDNLTIRDCYKQDNERTYKADYKLSRPNRIGGSVAVIANGVLNVYGGNYKNNKVNIEDSSTEEGRNSSIGGVFYNEGNLFINGGTFDGNEGARGGIVYNYQTVRIVAGTFINNRATKHAALYYAPSSAATQLVMGSKGADEEKVLVKNNSADLHSGIIYSSHFSAVVILGNTTFKNNQAKSGYGGVICASGALSVKGAEFIGNKATTYGGAIYLTRSNNDEITRLMNIEDCTFKENQAKYGGAVAMNSSAATTYSKGSIATVKNCSFQSNVSTSAGGAVYTTSLSDLTVEDSSFIKNKSMGEAGAMYFISKSKVTLKNNVFDKNEAASHGGALTVRSAVVDITGDKFTGNTAEKNGGAMYIAYSSAEDINSHVTLDSVEFKNNSAASGGAIYITRRAIEEDAVLLKVKNTTFEKNQARGNGGAVLFTAGVKTYFTNTDFTNNSSVTSGGAVQVGSNSVFELDNGTFAGNTSKLGGAITLGSGGMVLMNNIRAEENSSTSHGGFLYSEGGVLKLYDSVISENTGYSGGAMYLYTGAVNSIYNTEFSKNSTLSSESDSTGNGGALFIYTGDVETTIHSCKFNNNETGGVGGAMYISGVSNVKLYNSSATGNKAVKGGFMYETKAGTVVDIIGLTVSENIAQEGGSIIWGNTDNATLNIDKSKYTDAQNTTLDDGYWATAIEGKLNVADMSSEVSAYDPYEGKQEEQKPSVEKQPVSVEDVFTIAQNSSDGYINKNYDKLKKLDNSSNFMSRSTIDYPNINGETVTVDTFVYPTKGKADNGIVGLGILIYQSLLYKKANPDEEVYIDVSSYRFSVQSAINLNRNGRYFGYVRDLVGMNYDEFGFVRLSYLLITAAKMGIHVNVIGQLDGYPIDKNEPNFYEYFTQQLSDPCDPKYAEGKVIGDYLDFNFCYWTLDAKGGTDMMHTKMCTVSDYLDMNGVAHENAVWTSSSNLDGVKADGQNANWKQQTAIIVSNHDELYRISTNYLRLISSLCGQEEVIEFQDTVNARSTEQIDLIKAGKTNEIPADEQIVYIGTPEDDVFEMYFTPLGGGRVAWNETYNPYCKYVREMYESEDYILFTWNAAEYSGKFTLGSQIEEMIIKAFHENRNVKNKIFSHMESFDATTFDDLVVGKDIGYKSFMERPFGKIHNKDVQLSYVKDGQRYFVTLHNSLNMHGGSMYYQSNFVMVIKEKTCAENGVFSTIARYTTTGDIAAHSYDSGKVVKKATCKETGEKVYTCTLCNHIKTETIAKLSKHSYETIINPATLSKDGSVTEKCTVCDKIASTTEISCAKTVKLSEKTYVYDGKVKTPAVVVMDSKGNLLNADTDYTVTYADGRKKAGTYKVTVEMKGRYTGTKTLDFTIEPIDISACTVELSETKYVYDGEVKAPDVIVKNHKGTTLTKGTHYSVTYSEGRIEAGTYEVTVSMLGNYSGKKIMSFVIDSESTGTEFMCGDVDGNGIVNVKDATAIQKYIADLPVSVFNEAVADTDGNNVISVKDATAIQKWIADLLPNSNIGKYLSK